MQNAQAAPILRLARPSKPGHCANATLAEEENPFFLQAFMLIMKPAYHSQFTFHLYDQNLLLFHLHESTRAIAGYTRAKLSGHRSVFRAGRALPS